MWKKELLYFVFLILFPAFCLAQGLLPAPVIYLVTVNPETGYDEIIWKSIPLSPDDYYDVAVRMNPGFGYSDSYMPVGTNIHDKVYALAIFPHFQYF